jgi:hypothetical protein
MRVNARYANGILINLRILNPSGYIGCVMHQVAMLDWACLPAILSSQSAFHGGLMVEQTCWIDSREKDKGERRKPRLTDLTCLIKNIQVVTTQFLSAGKRKKERIRW